MNKVKLLPGMLVRYTHRSNKGYFHIFNTDGRDKRNYRLIRMDQVGIVVGDSPNSNRTVLVLFDAVLDIFDGYLEAL